MKKVIFIFAVAFAAISANAQIVSSRSTSIERTPSNKVKYFSIGLNLASASGDGATNLKSKALYDVSLGVHYPINQGFYFGMNYALSSRGYKYEDKEDYYASYTEKMTAHQIRITPSFGYQVEVVDKFKVDPHFGWFFSGDFAGNYKEEVDISGYGKSSDSQSIYDIEHYSYFDTGFQFGVALWYSSYFLDFSYRKGIIEWVKDSKVYSSNFTIRLGIAF